MLLWLSDGRGHKSFIFGATLLCSCLELQASERSSVPQRRSQATCGVQGSKRATFDLVQVFDLKQAMDLPLHNHGEMLEMLQREEQNSTMDRNTWKHSTWQKSEEEGRKHWAEASNQYFK